LEQLFASNFYASLFPGDLEVRQVSRFDLLSARIGSGTFKPFEEYRM